MRRRSWAWAAGFLVMGASSHRLCAGAPAVRIRPLKDPRYPVIVDDWPLRLDRRHRLFIDDEVVAERDGVERVVTVATRNPANPLVRPEHPWEDDMVLLYGSVERDPASGRFHMWYLGRNFEDRNPMRTVVCYARSEDGLRWEKPALGVVEYGGRRDNNIVVLNHGNGLDDIVAFIDPRETDPGRRFKMFVYQLDVPDRREGLYLYVSGDGIHWQEQPGPIIPGATQFPKNADHQFRRDVMVDGVGDVTTILFDPALGRYVANLKILSGGMRSRMMSESDDLIHWTRPRLILAPDEQDAGTELYGMCGFPYESLWLAVVQRFHAVGDRTLDLTWAVSHDGRNWSRVEPRDPWLPVGPPGAWDCGNISHANNPPIRVGDQLWFYYGGRDAIHNARPRVGAIGLAVLPADRFVALRASSRGTVLTRPLRFNRGVLRVNADATGGALRAELVAADGRAVPGYELEECSPLSGDAANGVIRWSQGETVEARDEPVRIRFVLERASLYAFWID